MEIKLLPIGTIVELEGSASKIMISGYCPVGSARPGYVWDYMGFFFPIGYRSANEIVQFDGEQITKIIAMGYQDEEQFVFMEKLVPALEELKGKNENSVKEEGED